MCFMLNHTYNSTIKNMPLNTSTGSTCSTSPLLCFHFWQPVYHNTKNISFFNDAPEGKCRFAGISKNAGHDMTFKILNT